MLEADEGDLKTFIVEDAYNSLVGSQTSEGVTWLVEDMEEEIKDEDVKEVNFYELWDVEFEKSLKDIDDGLCEDLVSDVWYAKEDWYGVFGVTTGVINSTRLDEEKKEDLVEYVIQKKRKSMKRKIFVNLKLKKMKEKRKSMKMT